MNALIQIRGVVESLSPERLEIQKKELLNLIDKIEPSAMVYPDGVRDNGNGQHQRLSPREREVMGMILNGRRLKEIAANLEISVKTVTTHRSRLLRKLGLEDNLGLYRYGIRNGLISV